MYVCMRLAETLSIHIDIQLYDIAAFRFAQDFSLSVLAFAPSHPTSSNSMGCKISKSKPRVGSKAEEKATRKEGGQSEEANPGRQWSDQSMTLKIVTLGGSQHQVKAEPSWSVQQLTTELLEVLKLSESSTEMITMILTFHEVELEPFATLTECGLCEDSEMSVLVKKVPRPSTPESISNLGGEVDDIGIVKFQKLGNPGAHWLRCNAQLPLPLEVHDLISLLAGKAVPEYKEFNTLGLDGLDKVTRVDNKC